MFAAAFHLVVVSCNLLSPSIDICFSWITSFLSIHMMNIGFKTHDGRLTFADALILDSDDCLQFLGSWISIFTLPVAVNQSSLILRLCGGICITICFLSFWVALFLFVGTMRRQIYTFENVFCEIRNLVLFILSAQIYKFVLIISQLNLFFLHLASNRL